MGGAVCGPALPPALKGVGTGWQGLDTTVPQHRRSSSQRPDACLLYTIVQRILAAPRMSG